MGQTRSTWGSVKEKLKGMGLIQGETCKIAQDKECWRDLMVGLISDVANRGLSRLQVIIL